MDDLIRELVGRIHASGHQIVAAITGGGSGAIASLFEVPGASRTVLEAIVPYDRGSLASYLGFDPPHACSVETAIAMSMRARGRAVHLCGHRAPCAGIAATASLISDRPKHGDHRCHIAVTGDAGSAVVSIVLEKGKRNRVQEEQVVSRAILYCIAQACGVEPPPFDRLLTGNDRWTCAVDVDGDPLARLLRGAADRLTVMPDGRHSSDAPVPAAVLAGSFAPLHPGHVQLAAAAERILGVRVAFELSIANVDKPQLDRSTIRRRLQQFEWRAPVELTRAPTFAEKAPLLPGTVFVVGADTALRIVAPKYYQDSAEQMFAALRSIAEHRCTFLVAARADSGRLQTLSDLPIPAEFQQMFREIPEFDFRVDISSSSIRRAAADL